MDDDGCATRFHVALGRVEDYRRAKLMLDRGDHPSFLGHRSIEGPASEGGLMFAQVDGLDVAVVLIQPRNSTLLALNVAQPHRGHGLGGALMRYLRPNFARVIGYKVGWFERQGYVSMGEPFVGRKWTTQVMVRSELRDLAGRAHRLLGDECGCSSHAHVATSRHRAVEQHGA